MAAVPQDPHQPLKPDDDVDGAQWFPVAQMRGMKGVTGLCWPMRCMQAAPLKECYRDAGGTTPVYAL